MEEMKVTLKEIVAQRLSAAPESIAKTELIEELAENLFCRYADLVNSGVEGEEAKARAVDALGDTDELVEYLKSLEPNQPLPELVLDPEKPDGGQIEEILKNVENILRGAFHKAKSAFHDVKETVKDGIGAEFKVEIKNNGDLSEAEQKMADLECAMEEKQQQIEDAKKALEQLESARDALEAVTDQTIVEQALADIEVKIGAKEAEIETLEAEYEALEEAFDAAEEEFDALEEELDGEEAAEEADAPEKGWKVTYHSNNRDFEMNSEEFKASVKDMMKDIEKVIREAAGTAKDVAKDACKVAKDAAGKVCDDVSAACTPDTPVEKENPIDAAQLRGIDVQTFGGDVTVRMSQEPEGDVLVGGDIEGLEVFRSADGVLTIRPIKTETSAFFFGRGIFNCSSSANVELELPRREWEFLKLSTTNGDVQVEGDCPVNCVTVASVSGDIRATLPTCGKAICKTTNGDIRWEGDASDFRMESISGDVEFRGRADRVDAKTTSGDLTLEGGICGASVKTISGDVCLRSDVLPDRMEMGTTSGDMWIDIPDAGPFTAKFRSTSGDFTSDFFTGRMGGRNCVFTYQGGGERMYSFASISGDVEIRKYR